MHRFTLPAALVVVLAACDQSSQDLPFRPDPDFVTKQIIGPAGGLVSHPMGISIEFPQGTFERATTISIAVGSDLAEFPGTPEGKLLRGTYFIVSPAAAVLKKPVQIDLAVPAATLEQEQRVRLGFATQLNDAGITTQGVSFDLTAGILHGELTTLGPVAAVISDNAVNIGSDVPPTLGGGTFADATGGLARSEFSTQPGTSRDEAHAADGPAGRSRSAFGPFTVACSHSGLIRRCVSSGTMELWASSEIQGRLSADMVLLNPSVNGSLEFTDFVGGVPTRAFGTLTATGTLRVQLGQAVSSFEVDDTFTTTGASGGSDLTVTGSEMVFAQTSVGARTVSFEVRPNGTGEQLVVRGQKSVDFENEDGTTTTATLFIDMRLRR